MQIPWIDAKEFNIDAVKEKEILLFLMDYNRVCSAYAVGYYDSVNDVFYVWHSPGYREVVSSREYKCGKYKVNLPTKYGVPKGFRKVSKVVKLGEAMKSLEWQDASKAECPEGYLGTYLVCLKDRCVMLSGISSFVEIGRSFTKVEEVGVSNVDKRAFVSSLDYNEVDKFALLE